MGFLSRRSERNSTAESRQARIERAQREELTREVREAEYQRADLDNASLRFSSSGRFRNGIVGLFGGGSRRAPRESLRDQGYHGD